MKKLIMLTLVAAATAGVQAQTISWNENNGGNVPAPSGVAGAVAATNWNNSINGISLIDNTGTASGVSFTITGSWGAWGIAASPGQDANGTYNRNLLDGYANTSSGIGPEVFTISGISYSSYNLIVYFSSDTAGRAGTITDGNSGITYDFSTMGPSAISGANAVLTQTTDTTGGNPTADYAVFSGVTGSSDTLTLNIANGGGIAGFQIVAIGAVAPTLSLQTDTTITSATNYVGGSATLSATFVGTLPITNQWKFNAGSGYVNIGGAIVNTTGLTNTTLVLTNLQTTNSGTYALFASNAAGTSNSTPVTLSVLAFPTNNLGINVQFTGSWLDGNAPTMTGAAVIGNDGDIWNTVSNPTGGTSPAGLARGTNLVVFDTGNIGTPITMDYVGDYIFNGTAFGFSNPFASVASPYANLMSGYMGSVSTTGPDTNTITMRHLVPGVYDLYLYVCGRSDGQTRVDVLFANDQSAVCGPNNGNYSLIAGVNYVHLTPTVTTNGVLNIRYYGTADAGQALLNGFQLNGPATNVSLSLSSDTTCDSPLNDYVGRTVSFSAAFAGFPTPSLQWKVDKGSGFVPITGATNSTLTLPNLQTTNSGNYALFATNAAGGLNSTALTLNVQPLPSPLAIDVQFDGTTYTGVHADPQVGPAVIGGGSDYWNPVSNPNPVGADTNPISGSLVLSDVNDYGTALTLSYTANQDYNNSGNTPFNGSGSPAANLMQASLVILNTNNGTATIHGLSAGVYDLYLYSCPGNNQQQVVTRFAANDSYDNCGPNNTNNILILETNYVHLTPTVTANGLLNISFVGNVTGQGNLNGIQLSGPGATLLPPVASFTGAPTNIFAGQSVVFMDASTGNITNWLWNFGDGHSLTNNSSANVTHAYATAGSYTVNLKVIGPTGSNTNTQVGYIVVNPAPTFGNPVLSGGNLVLSGVNGLANVQYRILSTTNLTLPLASWMPVWTNVFATDGSYSYTNSPLTGGASFFILVSP